MFGSRGGGKCLTFACARILQMDATSGLFSLDDNHARSPVSVPDMERGKGRQQGEVMGKGR